MLRLFRHRERRQARRRAASPSLPLRLRVEELERRDVPSALTPLQVRHAYGFDQAVFNANGQTVPADGSGQTIAIITAYNNSNIANDLKVFNQTFGLPAASLRQVTAQGAPLADFGWAQETALDVEWAHAIAPRANILLVGARSASLPDLLDAVDYARNQPGVTVVSMSWGIPEDYLDPAVQRYYDAVFTTPAGHEPVTFVAASGDSGAAPGAEWPAVSPNVLAVGGTSLSVRDRQGNYGGEIGWSGSGGGISDREPKPAYQANLQNTGARTVPDVSYNADPRTGYYVYATAPGYPNVGGWFQVGGTSAGAPQWAALLAIANQGRALNGLPPLSQAPAVIAALPSSDFHDITTGSNGFAAKPGFDLQTGKGSPKANQVIADLANLGAAVPRQTTNASAKATTAATAARRVVAIPAPVQTSTAVVGTVDASLYLARSSATGATAAYTASQSAVVPSTFAAAPPLSTGPPTAGFSFLATYAPPTGILEAVPGLGVRESAAPGSPVVPASADTERELIPAPRPAESPDEGAALPGAAELVDQAFQFGLAAPLETAASAEALSAESEEGAAPFHPQALLAGAVIAAGIVHRSLRRDGDSEKPHVSRWPARVLNASLF